MRFNKKTIIKHCVYNRSQLHQQILAKRNYAIDHSDLMLQVMTGFNQFECFISADHSYSTYAKVVHDIINQMLQVK